MNKRLDPDKFLCTAVDYPAVRRVSTTIPDQPFCVHPDDVDGHGPFHVTRYERRWHLIDPEIAENEFVPKKTRAYLYRAIREDGSLVLLVIAEPWPGFSSDWFDAWQGVIPTACKQWVTFHANHETKDYSFAKVAGKAKPKWPKMDFADWLTEAFRGRVIDSMSHRIFGKGSKKSSTFDEDFEGE